MGHSSSVLGVTASVVSDTSLSLDLSQGEEFISYSDGGAARARSRCLSLFSAFRSQLALPAPPACLTT